MMTSFAALYSQVSSPQAQDGLKLIDRISPFTNSHVLDLGCGTGYLASVLAELVRPGGKVTGVDPDRERIQVAREQYGSISNLVFLEGNGEEFSGGPYDAVFANLVMHWINDKEAVFQNVFRHLKMNGQFLFNASDTIPPIFNQLDALIGPDKPKFMDLLHVSPPDVCEAIATRCGFQVEYKSTEWREYIFPKIETFSAWIHATTGGRVGCNSINQSALDDFKSGFGDETFTFGYNMMTYVFRKV